jgi:hypothetical protein
MAPSCSSGKGSIAPQGKKIKYWERNAAGWWQAVLFELGQADSLELQMR